MVPSTLTIVTTALFFAGQANAGLFAGKIGESCAITGQCEKGLTCIEGIDRCLELNCVAEAVAPLYEKINEAFENVIIETGGDPSDYTTLDWPAMAKAMKADNFPLYELQDALAVCPEAQVEDARQSGFTPIAGGFANAAAVVEIIVMLHLGIDVNGDIGLFFQWYVVFLSKVTRRSFVLVAGTLLSEYICMVSTGVLALVSNLRLEQALLVESRRLLISMRLLARAVVLTLA